MTILVFAGVELQVVEKQFQLDFVQVGVPNHVVAFCSVGGKGAKARIGAGAERHYLICTPASENVPITIHRLAVVDGRIINMAVAYLKDHKAAFEYRDLAFKSHGPSSLSRSVAGKFALKWVERIVAWDRQAIAETAEPVAIRSIGRKAMCPRSFSRLDWDALLCLRRQLLWNLSEEQKLSALEKNEQPLAWELTPGTTDGAANKTLNPKLKSALSGVEAAFTVSLRSTGSSKRVDVVVAITKEHGVLRVSAIAYH